MIIKGMGFLSGKLGLEKDQSLCFSLIRAQRS